MKSCPLLKFFVVASLSGFIVACSKYGDFTEEQICRATVAAIKGKSPTILMVDSKKREAEKKITVFSLSYKRPDDGKKWVIRCKVDRTRVVWAQGNGRWRDQEQDPTVRFRIKGDEITIKETFPDGSRSNSAEFNISMLGG